ncbi:MAG: ABC transporter permease [Acidimicrobiales bacterium]
MARLVRIIGQYSLVVLAAIVGNFALPRLAPGGPIEYLAPPDDGTVTAEEREEILARFDLDGSTGEQFIAYIGGLVRGDLGTSIRDGRPVTEAIGDRIGWSLLLVGTAVLVSSGLGVTLGFAAGWRRGSRLDAGVQSTVLGVDALPAFFVGLMLLLVFSVKLGWFPVYGAVSASSPGGLARVGDIARRLVLPGLTLTLVGLGSVFVVARSAMISETGEDYVFMARAKGLSETAVRRHARRNALLPVSTASLLGFSTLVGAATVVETVFSYPGLGSLGFAAVRTRDYPLLQGVFLLFALLAIGVNLLNDLLYPLFDPRVRSSPVAGSKP